VSTGILLVIDQLQKLPLTRLQGLWEWKKRVLLEEYYADFGKKHTYMVGRVIM